MKTYLVLIFAFRMSAIMAMEAPETALRLKASCERENGLRQDLNSQLVAINNYRNQIATLEAQIKLSQETIVSDQNSTSSFWGIAKKGIPTVFGLAIGIAIGYYTGSQNSTDNNKDKKNT